MSAYRVDSGLEAYFAFLGRVLMEDREPDYAERAGSGSLDFGMEELGNDPGLAARARSLLHAADWRSVEELSLAGRNANVNFKACARLALAVLHSGQAALDAHADAARIAVRDAAQSVRVEIHRLLGILRFSPLGERAWLAVCRPDHALIEVLVPHFCERFGSDSRGSIPFAIQDAGRGLAVGRDALGGRFGPIGLDKPELHAMLGLESGELPVESGADESGLLAHEGDAETALWQTYFKAAANPARANPALQRRFVPDRYREWLPEFRDNP